MSYSTSIQTSRSIRDSIANSLVSLGKPVYRIMRFRRKPWQLTKEDLSLFPSGSLGRDLYDFLEKNQFELMPRAEFHDVFHVLFQYGTSMREETSIQFVVIGNGKWSLPNLVSSFVAIVFYPENWSEYKRSYLYGRQAETFHDLRFSELLDKDVNSIRQELRL